MLFFPKSKFGRWLMTGGLSLLLMWFIWLLIPPSAEPVAPVEPYLDMHVHTAGLGKRGSGAFVSEEFASNWKFPIYMRAFGVTEKELTDKGDGIVLTHIAKRVQESRFVDKAVVVALDGVVDENGELDRSKTQVYVPNKFLFEELKNHPNLLLGASINPYRHDALARLDKVAGQGAVLIKWIPNIMHIDPSDEAITPFYKRMVELGLPLLTHTGKEQAFGDANDDLGDPHLLRLPLNLGVTVIAAHIATTGTVDGQEQFDRFLEIFRDYPNLYADISSLTQINKLRYLNRALKVPDLEHRLIYGTDWPLHFFPVVSPFFQIGTISIRDIKRVRQTANVWDRDVVLKTKMGVPEAIFARSRLLLLPDNEHDGREDEDKQNGDVAD